MSNDIPKNLPKAEDVTFSFVNFIIKESHIVIKDKGTGKIHVDFNPKGFIYKSKHQFHLELAIGISEEEEKFSIRIVSYAVFEFEENADLDKYRNSFFIINAPAIMFPYIRAFVSSLTSQSGVVTVTLPTFNLLNVGEFLKDNIEELE